MAGVFRHFAMAQTNHKSPVTGDHGLFFLSEAKLTIFHYQPNDFLLTSIRVIQYFDFVILSYADTVVFVSCSTCENFARFVGGICHH